MDFFFFSSRRRHTRCSRDWSSDVCSSDLMAQGKAFDRAVVIVLDSVGAGALPDAARFGDEGADTLGHIRDRVGLALPNLGTMGLGRFVPGIGSRSSFTGASARMSEVSNGKDTLVGHWEMIGVVSKLPFRTYPEG